MSAVALGACVRWLPAAALALAPFQTVRADDERVVLAAPAGTAIEDVRKQTAPLLSRIEAIGYRDVTAEVKVSEKGPIVELASKSGFPDAMRREIEALSSLRASRPTLRIRFTFETEREASQWVYPKAPEGAAWVRVRNFKLDPRDLDPKRWDESLALKWLVRADVVLTSTDFTFGKWDLSSLEDSMGEDYTRTKDPVCCPLTAAGLKKMQPVLGAKPAPGKERPTSFSAVLLIDEPGADGIALGYDLGGTVATLKLEGSDAPHWAYWQMKNPLPSLGGVNLDAARTLILNPIAIPLQVAPAK